MSYIYKGVDTVGAEGTEVPTVSVSSSHGLCAYAQVVAYGSDAVCRPVKAAEAPPHLSICVYAADMKNLRKVGSMMRTSEFRSPSLNIHLMH